MRISRLAILALTSVAACSSASSGSHTTTDAPAQGHLDAPGSGSNPIDAPASGGDEGIGKSCTPGSGTGLNQGDCPTGYICMSLMNGTHPWCSKTCTSGTGDMCNVGYTGIGKAYCLLSVASVDYCSVMCEDDTSTHQFCSATQCTGACPSSPALTCNVTISGTDGSGNAITIGKGCQ